MDIWFLCDNKEFEDRSLKIGICPKCGKNTAELSEKSKITGEISCKSFAKKQYDKIILSEMHNVLFSSSDVNKKYVKTPFGWVYGVNTAVKKKSAELEIRQYAKDFFGQSKLIKKINQK